MTTEAVPAEERDAGSDAETEHLDWGDIEQFVKPIMSVWVDGAELHWGAYAWQALAQAGLASFTTEADRTRCLIRALALAALAHDFYVRAFDEGTDGEWEDDITSDLVGGYPLIDAFTLGQLAEREGVEADNSPTYDAVIANVLRDLVHIEYGTVAQSLRSVLRDDVLFASLIAAPKARTRYPLAEQVVFDAVNEDLTANKHIAWEWITLQLPDPHMEGRK